MVDDLYTNDPEFIATPLNSPHPPPRIHSTQRGTPSGIREQQPRPKLTPLPASPARPGFRTDKVIPSQQTPQWLSCNEEPEAGGWLEKLSVVVEQARPIDHSLFCDKEIVDDLISTKLRIGAVAPSDLYRARTLANPYESIGRSIFVNRSAVKMANLDAMCRFRDAPIRTGSSELRFVDVCAGPGGFTEYMLWRARQRKVRARGWGMTLRGPQDFALDDIAKLEPKIRDLFVPFYGEKDTGDVYSDTHLRGFADRIRTDTDDKGVDLVMGDGGFNVDGDELNQEDHSRQLILCQIVIMFMTLRKKGDFTVKVFDTYHPFTVQLLYILYRYFDKMAIIKPFTSRPANAERYIVCHSLKVERPQNLIDHLLAVNARFNALKPDDDDATGPLVSSHAEPPPGLIPRDVRIRDGMDDVVGIMDPDVVMRDETFLTRIRSLNMRMSMWQKEALEDLYRYVEDDSLPGFDQTIVRRQCLIEWKLPIPEDQQQREARLAEQRHRQQQQPQHQQQHQHHQHHQQQQPHHQQHHHQHASPRYAPYHHPRENGDRRGDSRRDDGGRDREGGGRDRHANGSGRRDGHDHGGGRYEDRDRYR